MLNIRRKRTHGEFDIRSVQNTVVDKVFVAMLYIFLFLVLVVVLYPLLFVLSASFSSPGALRSGKVWLLPVEPTLMAYEAVFKSKQIIMGFANSLFYLVAGTFVNVAMTMTCAYPLSRRTFIGRGLITGIFVVTMYFGGGLIPTYMLISKLGLIDSRWVMIIPGAMNVWFVLVARTFLQANIPDEMFEAAQIDGCGEFLFYLRMVLPLSASIIAVLALYYGVGHWNSYFNAMIYLKSQHLFPLQLVLRSILIQNKVDSSMIQDVAAEQGRQFLSDLLKYAVIVVSSVPVMLAYPFVQRHFIKGVMVGALKG